MHAIETTMMQVYHLLIFFCTSFLSIFIVLSRFLFRFLPAPAPSNVVVTKVESTSITVQWDEITSGLQGILQGYRVRHSMTNPLDTERVTAVGNSSHELKIDGLHPYTNYTIQVSGYIDRESGNWSSPITVLTDEAGK